MRINITKCVEKKDTVLTCDFCGSELLLSKNNSGCYIRNCKICGKEFCDKCGKPVWGYGDYPDYFCNVCHKTYIEYKPKFDKIDEEYDDKREALDLEWTTLAKQRSNEKVCTRS